MLFDLNISFFVEQQKNKLCSAKQTSILVLESSDYQIIRLRKLDLYSQIGQEPVRYLLENVRFLT